MGAGTAAALANEQAELTEVCEVLHGSCGGEVGVELVIVANRKDCHVQLAQLLDILLRHSAVLDELLRPLPGFV